jgi:hypothetical protein
MAAVGPYQIQLVSRILQVPTATDAATGTLMDLGLGPDLEQQSDFTASNHRVLIDTGAEVSTTHQCIM